MRRNCPDVNVAVSNHYGWGPLEVCVRSRGNAYEWVGVKDKDEVAAISFIWLLGFFSLELTAATYSNVFPFPWVLINMYFEIRQNVFAQWTFMRHWKMFWHWLHSETWWHSLWIGAFSLVSSVQSLRACFLTDTAKSVIDSLSPYHRLQPGFIP